MKKIAGSLRLDLAQYPSRRRSHEESAELDDVEHQASQGTEPLDTDQSAVRGRALPQPRTVAFFISFFQP